MMDEAEVEEEGLAGREVFVEVPRISIGGAALASKEGAGAGLVAAVERVI
jgi:hypothetical protein